MRKIEVIGFIVFIIFIFCRSTNPFEEDQKIFFASAFITDNSPFDFPENVYQTFELKPVLSRIFYFSIFKFLQPIGIWEDKILFIQAVQGIFILIIVIGAFLYSRNDLISKRIQNILFICATFFLISVGSESFMQVEHVAVVLSLFVIWTFSKKGVLFDISAGVLLAIIAGLKGVTIFYSLALIVYCFFFVKKNVALLSGVFIFVFSYILIISLKDIEAARLLQGNNFDVFRPLKNLVRTWKYIFIDQVYLLSFIGYMLLFFFILFKNIQNKLLIKKFYLPNLIIILVLIPSIIFQVGFSYHYFGILLFLLLLFRGIIDLQGRTLIDPLNKFLDLKLITPSLIAYLIFSSNFFSHSKNLMEKNISNFNSEILVNSAINNLVSKDDTILFLTDGVINFYLNNFSACIEFYPITINRLMPNYPNIPKQLLVRYRDILSCVQNYNGKFILIQTNWLPPKQYHLIYPNYKYAIVANLNTIERKYILFKKIR